MFGLGKGNKDDERWWNLIMFNFYGTDEEFESAAPAIVVIAAVVIILLLIFL